MVCEICGTSNPDNAIYCASCGTRLPQNNAHAYAQHTYTAPNPAFTNTAAYSNPDARWRTESAKPGDPSKNWAGVTGFIMGILSIVVAPIGSLFALPGLIISIVGRKSQQRGLAIAGIITSIIGLMIILGLLAIIAYFLRYGYEIMGTNEWNDLINEFNGYGQEYLSALTAFFLR